MDAFVEGLYEDDQVTVKGLAVLSVVFTILWTSLDFGCLAVKGLFRAVGVDAGERRQRLFFLSSIHAVVVTAFSAYKLLAAERDDFVGNREVCTFTLGYFINDWLGSAKQWLKHMSEFTHHVLAIGVTVAVLCTPAVTMFVPAFLVVEGSTVFYNIAWFLKKNGQEQHPATLVVMLFFTISFFLLRVVWMPYATYDVMVLNTERWHQMGLFKYALVPICCLQYYWFAQILSKLFGLIFPKDTKGKTEKGKAAKKQH